MLRIRRTRLLAAQETSKARASLERFSIEVWIGEM
jgi:hypothetical protein